MNTHLFPRIVIVTAGIALASIAAQAQAASSSQQIAKARSECAMQKQRVQQLERRSTDLDNDPQLIRARQQWEQACVKASKLMEQSGVASSSPEPSSAMEGASLQ